MMMKCAFGWSSKNAPDAYPLDDFSLTDLKIISIRIERQPNLAAANRVCRTIYETATSAPLSRERQARN
jgi:hypothetical protein